MTWSGDINETPLAEDMPPSEINRVMIATRRIAWSHVKEMRRLAAQKAEAKKTAKRQWAKAMLSSDGPIEIRKAHAILASEDAQFQYDIADELISTCRQALDACHDDFEALRSINADLRAERSGRAQP
jgi:hypothetical protein